MTRLLVIGAAGDVGQGVVSAALARGWTVAAAGRNEERLARLGDWLGQPANLRFVAGDIGSDDGASALRDTAQAALGGIDAVVVAVNAPNENRPLLEWTSAQLGELLETNLLSHFAAAKALIPALEPGGSYIAIGGGTADFVIAGAGQLSICQAAQRMMIRAIAKEHGDPATYVRELMIVSMVNGEKKRAIAQPDWLTDAQIGDHVTAIIAEPALFKGAILTLKSGDPIGRPA